MNQIQTPCYTSRLGNKYHLLDWPTCLAGVPDISGAFQLYIQTSCMNTLPNPPAQIPWTRCCSLQRQTPPELKLITLPLMKGLNRVASPTVSVFWFMFCCNSLELYPSPFLPIVLLSHFLFLFTGNQDWQICSDKQDKIYINIVKIN